MSKELTEQQLGKEIYQKHKSTYKIDLANGTLPQIGNYPPSTLNNIKIGIAYEALKEEDFEAAHSFFFQLGKEYTELADFTGEMERRNPQDKNSADLSTRIYKISNHQTRHDFIKKEINILSKKYELLNKVKNGEYTLAERVNMMEKEYFNMLKLKKKEERKQAIENYQNKLVDLISPLSEFYNIDQPKLDFKTRKGVKVAGHSLLSGGILTTIGSIAAIPIAVITANPLIVFGLFAIVPGLATAVGGCDCLDRAKKEDIKRVFQELKIKAGKIDNIIKSAYMPNIYKNNTQTFKERFETMDSSEQKLVIKEILKTQSNKELDLWLTENYPKLVEDEGRWNLTK